MLGLDPLHDLVDFCTLWIAKTLYLNLLGEWPGPQHCGAAIMVSRSKPNEHCRCGGPKLWRDCHMGADCSRSRYSLELEAYLTVQAYYRELKHRGLETDIAAALGYHSRRIAG